MEQRRRPRKRQQNRKLLPGAALALALVVMLAMLWLLAEQAETGGQTPPAASLPKHNFQPEDFSLINGRMHYDGPCRFGIDVSVHQNEVDWAAAAEDGVSFAIVRMGYRGTTEGGLFRDESFRQNVEGAQAVGIETGAYFFSQAVTVDEAIQEAELAIEILESYDMAFPIMYDWEVMEGTRSDGVDYATVTACAKAFCQRLEEAGYRAGVYFNLEMAKFMDMAELKDYVLWLADYNESPRFAYKFDFWQYSATGAVSGITGDVDLNLYFVED